MGFMAVGRGKGTRKTCFLGLADTQNENENKINLERLESWAAFSNIYDQGFEMTEKKRVAQAWNASEIKALLEVDARVDGDGNDWKRWAEIMKQLEAHPAWSRVISVSTVRRRSRVLLQGKALTSEHYQKNGPDGCLTFPNFDAGVEAYLLLKERDKTWKPFPAVCDGSYRLPVPKKPHAQVNAMTISPQVNATKAGADLEDWQIALATINQIKSQLKAQELRITRLEKSRRFKNGK